MVVLDMFWLADSDGETMGQLSSADEVRRRREIRRAYEKAPHLPIAGTSSVSPLNENPQLHLLCSGAATALRAMDSSPLVPARSKGPPEVRDASRSRERR